MDKTKLADNESEACQLLTSVHSIFASKSPSVQPYAHSTSYREILENLETVFGFEIWLLPDVLQEAQTCGLFENSSRVEAQNLASLLELFERHVDDRVLVFQHKQSPTANQVCDFA